MLNLWWSLGIRRQSASKVICNLYPMTIRLSMVSTSTSPLALRHLLLPAHPREELRQIKCNTDAEEPGFPIRRVPGFPIRRVSALISGALPISTQNAHLTTECIPPSPQVTAEVCGLLRANSSKRAPFLHAVYVLKLALQFFLVRGWFPSKLPSAFVLRDMGPGGRLAYCHVSRSKGRLCAPPSALATRETNTQRREPRGTGRTKVLAKQTAASQGRHNDSTSRCDGVNLSLSLHHFLHEIRP